MQSLYEITHWNALIEYDSPTVITPLSGMITDLTLPTLEREFDTDKRAGELGVVPRPKFYNEVEVSFTVRNVFEDLIKGLIHGTTRPIKLTAKACVEDDLNAIKSYVVVCQGFISSFPFGELSEDGYESEISMMCYEFTANLGTLAINYKPREYLLEINGTNMFANAKDVILPPAS